jgi:hypothetical protein
LTRLTAKQIWFGLWFPRFWLAVKIFAIPLVSAWLIALPQLFVLPTKLSLWLLAIMAMATFVMPFFFLAAALYLSGTGIAGGESSAGELIWLMTFVPFIMLIHSAFQRSPVPFMLLAFGLAVWLVTFSCAIFMLPLGVLYLRGVGKLMTAKGYEEWLKRAEEIARKRKRQG